MLSHGVAPFRYIIVYYYGETMAKAKPSNKNDSNKKILFETILPDLQIRSKHNRLTKIFIQLIRQLNEQQHCLFML